MTDIIKPGCRPFGVEAAFDGRAGALPMSVEALDMSELALLREQHNLLRGTVLGQPGRLGGRADAALSAGPHAWGKKIIEEAGELWLAIEHEDDDAVAAEAGQLLWRVMVGVIGRGVAFRRVLESM